MVNKESHSEKSNKKSIESHNISLKISKLILEEGDRLAEDGWVNKDIINITFTSLILHTYEVDRAYGFSPQEFLERVRTICEFLEEKSPYIKFMTEEKKSEV